MLVLKSAYPQPIEICDASKANKLLSGADHKATRIQTSHAELVSQSSPNLPAPL